MKHGGVYRYPDVGQFMAFGMYLQLFYAFGGAM